MQSMAKRMAEQMELFEPVERGFDEGGLMDEGGTVDPVSGNDVPPGSTQEEVRDDIPAQLSEGEFVFPADVVRYIGLENLMRMRQEAKQGLAEMEAMGQMGNSEEATMPDDLPFNMYDLDVEDDSLTMQQGGFVNPQTGTYQMPGTGITGFQQAPMSTTGFNPNQPIQPYFKPTQFTQAQYQDPLQVTNIPTFGDTVGTGFGQFDEEKTFVNDAGQILKVPFKDGKPLFPIPEGYSEQSATPKEEQTPTATITPTTGQRQVTDGPGDDKDDPSITQSTDVTGFKVTTKGLTSDLQDVFNKYGSGFGVLKETFLDKPASALMKASSKMPTSIMGLLSKATGSEYEPSAKTASLNAASLQGVLDAFRGIKDDAFANPVPGVTAPRRTNDIYGGGIVGTKDFGTLDKTTQNIVATVARATVERAQSFYFDENGDPLTSSQTNKGYREALNKEFGMKPEEIEAIARRGGNYNQNEKLANEWAKKTTKKAIIADARTNPISREAIEDFNKDAKESEVSFSTDTYDRSREASFSDEQPGSVSEQAEAEKQSADLGIFG